MHFTFYTNLTEKDYWDLNYFWSFKTKHGKKRILTFRVFLFVLLCAFSALILFRDGFVREPFLRLIPIAVLLIVFQIGVKPFFVFSLKAQIKSLKKRGKLPFSANVTFCFDEDSYTKITPDEKSEVKYNRLERISIVGENAVYLHFSAVQASIIPFSCFANEQEREAFLAFLKTKCPIVDIYKK